LRHRRLCHPERHVRRMAHACVRGGRLCVQEAQHSVGPVHARTGARQSCRGVVSAGDDRRGRGLARVLVELARWNDHHVGAAPAVLAIDQPGAWASEPPVAFGGCGQNAAQLNISGFKNAAAGHLPITKSENHVAISGKMHKITTAMTINTTKGTTPQITSRSGISGAMFFMTKMFNPTGG